MLAQAGSRRGYLDASSRGGSRGGGGSGALVERQPVVAVAVEGNKMSQGALKWTLDNLVPRGQTVILVHVLSSSSSSEDGGEDEVLAREVFVAFRCFCARKDVRYEDVLIKDNDVAKGLIDFISRSAVEKMVVGLSSSRSSLVRRFRSVDRDVSTAVFRGAPDFCTVYVVGKGKISQRDAVRPAPLAIKNIQPSERRLDKKAHFKFCALPRVPPVTSFEEKKKPTNHGGRFSMQEEFMTARLFDDSLDIDYPHSRCSVSSDTVSRTPRRRSRETYYSHQEFSVASTPESARSSFSSQWTAPSSPRLSTHSRSSIPEEVEEEMRRLKQELKQTMDMYNTACKEALNAKQMAKELRRWKHEEKHKIEHARKTSVAALALAEREKAKSKAAAESAEMARRAAEVETRRRKAAEMAASKDAEERNRALAALMKSDNRYRRYTIEEIEVATDYFDPKRKIGEGGYGPVFKGILDHTPVAIKVLRPDAAQGRSQFQQEVQLLSCMRHPNMVLLLGACPEYGCLVYEYMDNGSLEDRLFRRKNSPALSWQTRFKIAAQIGTGLLFLHQARPEPVVHRDLKPGNILLDGNFVCKIADVGLARLVPSSAGDCVSQLAHTSTAGTFCYIDPEYQKTGILGTQSDIYSFGIILLQLLTGGQAMGLAHRVERAIAEDTFEQVLDPSVLDWPVEEALGLAKMAIRCSELRRKDRPYLNSEILPELNRLRQMGEESLRSGAMMDDSRISISNEMMSDHPARSSGVSWTKSSCSE